MKVTIESLPGRGTGVDVLIHHRREATVADLLGRFDGAADGALRNRRTGTVIGPATGLGAGAILNGDVLEWTADGGARDRVSATIEVVDGPAAGASIRVGAGAHVVGGGDDSHITIPGVALTADQRFNLVVDRRGVRAMPAGTIAIVSVNGVRLEGPRALAPTDVVELGETSLTIALATAAGTPADRRVRRGPRPPIPTVPEPVRVGAPPSRPPRGRIPLATALVPLLLVGVMALGGLRGSSLLVVGLMSPAIAIASRFEAFFGGRRTYRKAVKTWQATLSDRLADTTARANEAVARGDRITPTLAALIAQLSDTPSDVWGRRPGDEDFLSARIGTTTTRSFTPFELEPGGDDGLREQAEAELRAAAAIDRPDPVPLLLRSTPMVGVIGAVGDADEVARAVVAQLVISSGPADLVLALAVSSQRSAGWRWTRWLPHADWLDLDGPAIASGLATGRALVDRLIARLRDEGSAHDERHILLVLDAAVGIAATQLEVLLTAGGERLHVLLLAASDAELPRETRSSVRVVQQGSLVDHATGASMEPVEFDRLAPAEAEAVARALAPIEDPARSDDDIALPNAIGVLELLDSTGLTGRELAGRWAEAPTPPFQAVVGRSTRGDAVADFTIDHLLVGGTTGSGKSELLQALVCSMALAMPPTRLNFLFVDYKGGAAFRDVAGLPHTAGYVTDLEPYLVLRTLASLRAEIRHRKQTFDRAGVIELAELEQRDPVAAPARLMVIIDEFATLLRDVPGFGESIVELAEQGRSLGVRVVLATQRPAGIVSEKMRANIRLAIALRVNTAADSTDVVGVPTASGFSSSTPGRAVGRLGESGLQVFQSAYAGARGSSAARVTLTRLVPWEPLTGIVAAPSTDARTDLERIVDATNDAAGRLGLPAPSAPWQPPLPETLPLDRLARPDLSDRGDSVFTFGLLDEPAEQRQRSARLDLTTDGHLIIYGSGRSGKTTTLRTIAAALASQTSPERLHIYGIDGVGRGLRSLLALPHVGAVAAVDEAERLARIVGTFSRALGERGRRFADQRVGSLDEYQTATGQVLPRLVLLLDGYASFAATYERDGALLGQIARIAAEGRAVGVHLIVTTERPNGPLGLSALTGAITRRLVLKLGNDADYASVGMRVSGRDETLQPGRGWLDGVEIQVAVAGADASNADQQAALQAIGDAARAHHPGSTAPAVRELPAFVDRSTLPVASPGSATVGMRYDSLEPIEIERDHGHVLVFGARKTGRSTTLETIATAIAASTPAAEVRFITPRRSWSVPLLPAASVAAGVHALPALTAALEDAQRGEYTSSRPLIVVIDDAEDFTETAATSVLDKLVAVSTEDGLWVVAAVETQSARVPKAAWVRRLRNERHGIVLDAAGTDLDLLGAAPPPGPRARRSLPGRGYRVTADRSATGGEVQLIQVAAPSAPAQPLHA